MKLDPSAGTLSLVGDVRCPGVSLSAMRSLFAMTTDRRRTMWFEDSDGGFYEVALEALVCKKLPFALATDWVPSQIGRAIDERTALPTIFALRADDTLAAINPAAWTFAEIARVEPPLGGHGRISGGDDGRLFALDVTSCAGAPMVYELNRETAAATALGEITALKTDCTSFRALTARADELLAFIGLKSEVHFARYSLTTRTSSAVAIPVPWEFAVPIGAGTLGAE
jgi:hypothetical protein